MTTLRLSRDSKDLVARVGCAGLYDWSTFLGAIGDPADEPDAVKKAIASSPVATIGKWTLPVLLVQADDDRNVSYSQATELTLDLREHKIPHDEIVIPNEIHDLAHYASRLQLFAAESSYFERKLETGTAGR